MSLTDPRDGFLARRGLEHTRYALQNERPSGSLLWLAISFFFAFLASVPLLARLANFLISVVCLLVFASWSVSSLRSVWRAWRKDVDERRELTIRQVMES